MGAELGKPRFLPVLFSENMSNRDKTKLSTPKYICKGLSASVCSACNLHTNRPLILSEQLLLLRHFSEALRVTCSLSLLDLGRRSCAYSSCTPASVRANALSEHGRHLWSHLPDSRALSVQHFNFH